MADKKNNKGKNKKSKIETFAERSNEQTKPKIEAESNNNNIQSDEIRVVPVIKKKRDWDTFFNRGGQISNIILGIIALFLLSIPFNLPKQPQKL